MIVPVSLIAVLRRLLVPTIFHVVHPYNQHSNDFILVSHIFSCIYAAACMHKLTRCALPSRAELCLCE